MKFEKFLKMSAGRGVIVEREDGSKWLWFNGVLMKIPDGVNIIAASKMDDRGFISHIFDEFADENCSGANLTGAKLPTPDASASKVIRIFTDGDGGEIGISNKHFSLIERGDGVVTVYDDYTEDDTPVALMIIEFSENAEVKGVIFDDNYFSKK